MHELILWAGFLGAWALVAGPVYQAMLELRAEDVESARLHAQAVQVSPPAAPSRWWLLVPPVYFATRHRQQEAVKDQWLALLADDDFAALAQFSNKAAAWVMVGFGGLMIAIKETDELVDGNQWPGVVFWVAAVVLLVLSLSFGLSRLRWMDRELRRRRTRQAGHPAPVGRSSTAGL